MDESRTMRRRSGGWARAACVASLVALASAACGGTTGGVGSEPPVSAEPSAGAPDPGAGPGLPDPEVQSSGRVTVTLDAADRPLAVAPVACSWADGAVEAFIALGPIDIAGEAVYVDLAPSAPDPADAFSLYRDEDAAYHAGPTSGAVEIPERGPGDASGTVRFTDLAPDPATLPPDVEPPAPGASLRPLGDDPSFARLSGTAAWSCDPEP